MTQPVRVRRFRLWPVLLWGLLTYLIMAGFFGFFFVAADHLKDQALRGHPGHPGGNSPGWSVAFQLVALAVGYLVAIGWHRPLGRTFRALARGKTPTAGDLAQARRRIFRSPLMVGVVLPSMLGVVQVVQVLVHLTTHGNTWANLPPEIRALGVNLLLLVLSGFFSYLWQRHRIQTHFLVPLFTPEELTTRLPPSRDKSIGQTLVALVVLSAVLPVAVVLTLLATGVTTVANTASLTPAQWALLLGSPELGDQARALLTGLGVDGVPVMLINTLDTWRILVGSVLGVGFMLGYVFFVFHWVGGDLAKPLYGLRNAMRRIEEGQTEAAQPVVTSNEVGELTLGFNRMIKGLGERDRIKGLFGQYLTREVSEAILDGRVNLEGDRYDVTVLFTDIRDFTALSDQLPPEEVFGFLNEYLDAMIEVLVDRGGFIDKFLGDGILTVFGLPVRRDDHALAAFEAAQDMQRKLTELNLARVSAGKTPIAIGSGLHSGPVIAGNVGSTQKLQFTVIGDTVNLASRLEAMNKQWRSSVTLSDTTWGQLPGPLRSSLPFIEEKDVTIRGKKDPITVYRLA